MKILYRKKGKKKIADIGEFPCLLDNLAQVLLGYGEEIGFVEHWIVFSAQDEDHLINIANRFYPGFGRELSCNFLKSLLSPSESLDIPNEHLLRDAEVVDISKKTMGMVGGSIDTFLAIYIPRSRKV